MNRNFFLLVSLLALPLPGFAISATPPYAEMQTNLGTITIKLNFDKAPITSTNFIAYANKGFYSNTLFHRAVKDFVIQGGGYDLTAKKLRKTDAAITNEANNGLSNLAGTVSMARTNDPNSATSQFFINLADNSASLDKKANSAGYAVFAEVVSGLDVVKAIGALNTFDISNNNDGFPFTSTNSPVFIEQVYLSDLIDTSKAIVRVKVSDGLGKVSSSPSGIKNCGTTLANAQCITTKPVSTSKKISLKATPAPNYVFTGWRGDCKGYKTTISLNLKINHNCTATFAKAVP